MNEPKQSPLERQAKALFDESVEKLDAASLSRLNRSRQRALEALGRGRRVRLLAWLPATGVVAAALVTVLVMRAPVGPDGLPVEDTAATDFEILILEDPEMLEDLEFYSWLDAELLKPDGNVG